MRRTDRDAEGGANFEVVTEEQFASTPGFGRTLRDALPLFAGVALLMAGAGLSATLIGVRAGLEGFGPTVTGVVLSAYYVGFLLGSLVTPRTISRVGHVRVFAGLASLGSAAVLLHAIRAEPMTWIALRLVSGLCLAGLYVAVETWLNGVATNGTRGGLLAAYMVVVTAGQGIGQLLFPIADPRGHAVFVLAAVLVSTAVVPVTLMTVAAPEIGAVERLSFPALYGAAPLAVVTVGLAGFAGAAILGGGGAVYASSIGLTQAQTSAMLLAALVGGLLLQVPFGRWSDVTDRRRVLAAAAALGLGGAVAAALLADDSMVALVSSTAAVGGASFVLYSLANAHLHDRLDPARMLAGGAAMVLVFGIGAVAGPFTVVSVIGRLGPASLFVLAAIAYGGVLLVAVRQLFAVAPVAAEDRVAYTPLPMGTTPTVSTLADVPPEALRHDVAEEASIRTDGGRRPYWVHGEGEPVILLGVAGAATWEPLLAALAANGLRAVGVELEVAGVADGRIEDDLLAVLHDLEIPTAMFVGLDGGAVAVAEFVAAHPERVDGAVVAAPALPLAFDRASLEGRALLVLTEDHAVPYWDEPVVFADSVATFVRHGAPSR